jgi:maltose O-acetyltransferase
MDWKDQFRKFVIPIFGIMVILGYKILGRFIGKIAPWYRQALWKAKLKDIGEGTHLGCVKINNPKMVKIGRNVEISDFVHIWGSGGLEIGNDTIIASHVAITTLTHEKNAKLYRETRIAKPVKIGNNVWIGSGAIILPGVIVGDGAIIGAGAVVTKNIGEKDIVVGVPARKVGVGNKSGIEK